MRTDGWEAILHGHLTGAATRPFEWGEHDCALWCAEWVRKATGNDFASSWRGKYSDEETLRRLLQEFGYATPADIADGTGLAAVSVKLAQRGDIVLHPVQDCLGICNGMFSQFLTVAGITRVSTLKCRRAWRV